jgi:hypothetical protein
MPAIIHGAAYCELTRRFIDEIAHEAGLALGFGDLSRTGTHEPGTTSGLTLTTRR